MKIVILDGYALNPGDMSWAGFESLAPCTLYDATPPEDTVARIGDADLIITNKTLLTREVFEACPSIRYVGVLATGYNVVDLAAASEHGVCVTNVPAYSTMSVAQMVFALLLELCFHAGHHSDAVHAGRWTTSKSFAFWDYPLLELDGRTLGIVGMGHIGRQVARIAQAFGMQVIAYDHHAESKTPPEGVRFAPLDAVLAEADVLTLHCPLTAENQGIINHESIAKMKDGAILINTARGPLINEADVRDALLSGKLSGAGVDVVSVEPMRADNSLLGAPNCIITPHIAWATAAARQRLMDVAVDNLRHFLLGDERNRVN